MAEAIKSEDIAAYLERSRGLERDHLGELIASRKRAWQVALGAGILALVAVGAVLGLTPLKQPPEMYVVRVDDATGGIEHVTTFAAGVRSQRPFRVLVLPDPANHVTRVVVDIAH